MARPKLNALPQDSVLQAHLRRQANWPEDARRLIRCDTGKRQKRELLDAIDRIGRANHLASQAEGGPRRSGGEPDTVVATGAEPAETILAETGPADTSPTDTASTGRKRPGRAAERGRHFGTRSRGREGRR